MLAGMIRRAFCFPLLLFASFLSGAGDAPAEDPVIPAVDDAMREMVRRGEIAGAVTAVAGRDRVLHLSATGRADIAADRPMRTNSLFWIASMTKPVTAVAVLMLQDEGRLKVSDPVAKYLPEFADLKTPSGRPANLTITQILTHTSGLAEASGNEEANARTLADLVPLWLSRPMQFEPGSRWNYSQSGINAASRIVEVVSGMSFDAFLQERLFGPLGMKDTTFFPEGELRERLATAYNRNGGSGGLEPAPLWPGLGSRDNPPKGNGGLFSTAPDYLRFCRMLLAGGTWEGRRYLSPEALRFLTTPQTGDLPTGFFQGEQYRNRGANYGWALGTCVLREPHEGAASMLSPGTFGHGGVWGTQAWIDPVKGVIYLLMVQRANFPNADASAVREEFQKAAAAAAGARP